MKKILVMGLPGAGKTTLSRLLAKRLGAVHFNADEIRAEINKDLGFVLGDRIEHARRMGWLCDNTVKSGVFAIADFVCPTKETRAAFGDAYVVWVDRIKEGRFADTNSLFEPPAWNEFDVRTTAKKEAAYWAEHIAGGLVPVFDPKKETALFIGRYQPFHDGHKALIEKGIRRAGQACIAVRDTHGADPLAFEDVAARIRIAMAAHEGRYNVIQLPNIGHVLYGRDVGYNVEQLELDADTQAISATDIRRDAGI